MFPAGEIRLGGSFLGKHRDEILHLVRHQEEMEKAEHPLNRIMKIDDTPDQILVTTTEIHLPRRIGEALRNAFHGELDKFVPAQVKAALLKRLQSDNPGE